MPHAPVAKTSVEVVLERQTTVSCTNFLAVCDHYARQYKREGKQLHFHISRHIAHLGWETPVFFTLFTLSTYGTVVSNCF
jgi:hypothetical protein